VHPTKQANNTSQLLVSNKLHRLTVEHMTFIKCYALDLSLARWYVHVVVLATSQMVLAAAK